MLLAVLIDLLGDKDAKLAIFDIYLATGDQCMVGIDGERIVLALLQFDHGAAPHAQQMVDRHGGCTEFDGDIDFNIVEGVHK